MFSSQDIFVHRQNLITSSLRRLQLSLFLHSLCPYMQTNSVKYLLVSNYISLYLSQIFLCMKTRPLSTVKKNAPFELEWVCQFLIPYHDNISQMFPSSRVSIIRLVTLFHLWSLSFRSPVIHISPFTYGHVSTAVYGSENSTNVIYSN